MTKHKTDDFVAIVASIVDSKQNQLSFFPHSTVWLSFIQCIHMPITADVAILMPTTTTMTELKTDHFTPCACARGKYQAFS